MDNYEKYKIDNYLIIKNNKKNNLYNIIFTKISLF